MLKTFQIFELPSHSSLDLLFI